MFIFIEKERKSFGIVVILGKPFNQRMTQYFMTDLAIINIIPFY